jgi:hypothetical protein
MLRQSVDERYAETIAVVQKAWGDFEELEFRLQPVIEKTALKLYEQDRELSKEYLTLCSNAQALKAIEVARRLTRELNSEN